MSSSGPREPAQYGITLKVDKLFVRVVCTYSLNSSSSELRGTSLEDPEWQEWMAFHQHVLTAVPEDVEEAAAPGDPADSEDPDAPPPITKLPLHRRILYAIYVNRCLEEWQDPNPPTLPPKADYTPAGKPIDRVPGKMATVDEFRTSRVNSAINSPQCHEEELDRSDLTRPEG